MPAKSTRPSLEEHIASKLKSPKRNRDVEDEEQEEGRGGKKGSKRSNRMEQSWGRQGSGALAAKILVPGRSRKGEVRKEIRVGENGKLVKTKTKASSSVSLHAAPNRGIVVPFQKTDFRVHRPMTKYRKTRVGNGKEMLPGVDQRNIKVRRAQEIYMEMIENLGGRDMISIFQDINCRNLAWMQQMTEEYQKKHSLGDEEFDYILHNVGVKTVQSVAKTLGMKRIPKDVTKDIEHDAATLEEHLLNQGATVDANTEDQDLTENPRKVKRVRMKKPRTMLEDDDD